MILLPYTLVGFLQLFSFAHRFRSDTLRSHEKFNVAFFIQNLKREYFSGGCNSREKERQKIFFFLKKFEVTNLIVTNLNIAHQLYGHTFEKNLEPLKKIFFFTRIQPLSKRYIQEFYVIPQGPLYQVLLIVLRLIIKKKNFFFCAYQEVVFQFLKRHPLAYENYQEFSQIKVTNRFLYLLFMELQQSNIYVQDP